MYAVNKGAFKNPTVIRHSFGKSPFAHKLIGEVKSRGRGDGINFRLENLRDLGQINKIDHLSDIPVRTKGNTY